MPVNKAILNFLNDDAPKTFKDMEKAHGCASVPRSTLWDKLKKLVKAGKVARVANVDGTNVKWYRVRT